MGILLFDMLDKEKKMKFYVKMNCLKYQNICNKIIK